MSAPMNKQITASLSEMKILKCREKYFGTQKCCLGPKLMKELNLKLGTFVKIDHEKRSFICKAWPREDLAEGYLEYDSIISVLKCDSNGESSNLHESLVRLGEGVNLKELSVTVVLDDLKGVKRCKGSLHERERLAKFVKNLLRNIGILKDCKISCSSLPLGELYKISYIIVDISSEDSVGLVRTNTEIKIDSVMSLERYKQKARFQRVQLGGLEKPAEMLRELVTLPFQHGEKLAHLGIACPTGVLLCGLPGCGKTSLVKQTSVNCDAHLLAVNSPEIFGSRPGESEENLRRKFQAATDLSDEGPCILFFDEIDTLCPKQGKGGGNAESRLVTQLCTLMDNVSKVKGLLVIAATNRPNQIDPSLRRPGRFDHEVFIGIPTSEERRRILTAQTTRMHLDPDVDLSTLADLTKGYVGADLVSVCQEVAYQRLRRQIHTTSEGEDIIKMKDFLAAIARTSPSTQRGSDILVDYKPVHWENIGGLEDVKVAIQQAVEWPMKHPDAFQRLGLPRPKGVLLYGPPGCCKTTLVKAAATSCKATFLSVSGAQLFSPFVGDSERKIAEVFQQARACAPSILFFDEIDSIVGKRSEGNSGRGVQERVLSTLLNLMDGIGIKMEEKTRSDTKVMEGEDGPKETGEHVVLDNNDILVVAATNRPDMLDEALLRPGRIDRIIYVPPPDTETRRHILQIHTKKMPLDNVDLEMIAQKTQMFTGADLENLCKEAALLALTQNGLDTASVGQDHFLQTLDIINPSLSEELLNKYKRIKLKSSK